MASDSDAPAGASGEGRVGGVRLNLDSPVEGISVQVRGLERLSAKSLEGELRDLAGEIYGAPWSSAVFSCLRRRLLLRVACESRVSDEK